MAYREKLDNEDHLVNVDRKEDLALMAYLGLLVHRASAVHQGSVVSQVPLGL